MKGERATVVAVAAILACCAVPALLALFAGAFVAAAGALVRYWPLTVGGLAVAAWGATRLIRLIRRRNEDRRDSSPSDFPG